jgi:hypothetical protein
MPAHRPAIRTIHGASSWRIANDVVDAWLTRDGGHLGPVHFKTVRGVIQPFSVAPWFPRAIAPDMPGVLRNLRGDFFCLPFGGNATPWRGEHHPVHGETAEACWRLVGRVQSNGATELIARLRTQVRPGVITKRVRLVPGQTVLYCSHEIAGMDGPMCLGHHAMLRFPDHAGAGRIACSGFRFGQVLPAQFENPAHGGYSSLRPGAIFRDLRRVPREAGGYADLTRYPAREGFEDLVLLATRSSGPLAWVAVTFPGEGYLWFALKNPKQLVSTLFWHSNGGRHYPPWNGRHRRVLGLEDVTAFFDLGLAASARPNPLSRRGVPTTLTLRPGRPLRIPYVMGVTAIPRGFDTVRRVRFGRDHIVFVSTSGKTVRQPVNLSFFSP